MIKEIPLSVLAKEFAEGVLCNTISKSFYYHNLEHTQKVVEAVEEIGSASKISPSEMEIVLTAAWLHDTGYCYGCMDHEKASQDISQQLLKDNNASDEFIIRF